MVDEQKVIDCFNALGITVYDEDGNSKQFLDLIYELGEKWHKSKKSGLTKDKKEILKSMIGTCNSKISLTDVLHEEREKSRPNHMES